jgi:hypothetical protein
MPLASLARATLSLTTSCKPLRSIITTEIVPLSGIHCLVMFTQVVLTMCCSFSSYQQLTLLCNRASTASAFKLFSKRKVFAAWKRLYLSSRFHRNAVAFENRAFSKPASTILDGRTRALVEQLSDTASNFLEQV